MGLLAASGLAVLWHPLAGLIAAITMAFTGGRNAAGAADAPRRRRNERLVSELLAHLPDDYVLVSDVALPNRPGLIDHIVIGPCGIVVIEPRHCGVDVPAAGPGRRLESDQAESGSGRLGGRAAHAVKEFLAGRHPDLGRSALRFVDSVVVFIDPRSPLEVYRTRSVVVRYTELLQFIRELARHRAMEAAVTAAVARTLSSVSAPRTAPSREPSAVALAPARAGLSSTWS